MIPPPGACPSRLMESEMSIKPWCCCDRCKAGKPHTNPGDRYYGSYLRQYRAICQRLGFVPFPIDEEEAWRLTSAVLDVFDNPGIYQEPPADGE